LVLYYCCTSLDHAKAIERDGFREDASIRVTGQCQNSPAEGPIESHAVIFLGVASDFDFDQYPVPEEVTDPHEREIPGRVLNAMRRAIWPEA
jgi:hypothetical protein